MKKKFASLVALSAALTLAFGMTVSAAGSTSTTTSGLDQAALDAAARETEVANPTVTVDGKEVKVELKAEPVTVEQQQAAETKAKADEKSIIEDVLSAAGLSADSVKDVSVKVLPGVSIEKPANLTDEQIKEVGVPVAITNKAITSGKYYVVLHTDGDGKATWEKPVKAEGNTIKFTVYSFSTFTPVEVNYTENGKVPTAPADPAPAAPAAPVAPAGPTAPQTGEALPIAGLMLVVCLAGAALCTKKARI